MKDLGFTPEPSAHPLQDVKKLFHESVDYGLRNPPVRWMMLAAPFASGVGIYTFYALQPYLLELWGNPKAYSVAGLAAAIVAGAQIVGGYLAPFFRRLFRKRTSALILATFATAGVLAALGLTNSFWVALVLLTFWAMLFAAEMPIRQAYINDMIPSRQRATVLSFDSLMGSSGGVVIQPVLGKVADVYSYSTSLVVGALIQLASAPFLLRSRREGALADTATSMAPAPVPAD
jgi:MFS family permease